MKINSCLAFALLLLFVSYALAVETLQPETAAQKENGGTDEVEPAYSKGGSGGGSYGGGSGGGGGGGGGGGRGGGGGYKCYHGCCYHGHYGCQKCCKSPEEAKAFAEKQAHP